MDKLLVLDLIEDALRLADAVAEREGFGGDVCDIDDVLCDHWLCQESGCIEWKRDRFVQAIGMLRTDSAQKQPKPTETDMNKAGADGV